MKTGTFMKQKRKEQGLTMRQLAKMARTSQPLISMFENSKVKPSKEVFIRIMQTLRVPRAQYNRCGKYVFVVLDEMRDDDILAIYNQERMNNSGRISIYNEETGRKWEG